MGIPYFFREIVNKNHNILINTPHKRCQRFFLDFNSIIHGCAGRVVHEKPSTYTHNDIFEEIFQYTIQITNIISPSDLLFIAVDGVAPRAKIQQQRRRRYMTAMRTEMINEFKIANGISITSWDSNCITPGTAFMKELDQYLKTRFNTHKLTPKVIISGHDERGEGEHKIIQYIKNNPITSTSDTESLDIIYGLDADLIMLTLSCEQPNLMLAREDDPTNLIFKYLDIDMLRKCVSRHLYNNDDIAYMYDYIVICFLLGNDFLPAVSFLKIKEGAIDTLCDAYKHVYEELGTNLVERSIDSTTSNTFTINRMFLVKLFDWLTKKENPLMLKAIEEFPKKNHNRRQMNERDVDMFIQNLENIPDSIRKSYNIHPKENMNWRMNYYYELFSTTSSSKIKDVTMKYIEGILWTMNYYFNIKYDESWYYPYNFAPCMADLYKYAFSLSHNEFINLQTSLKHSDSEAISSTLQMLMVLPPQSLDIFPPHLRSLVTSIPLGCTHMFPHTFKIETFLKSKLWECVPVLPNSNLHTLKIALASFPQSNSTT